MLLCFSHLAIWLLTRQKLLVHGDQSHSWSVEQGKGLTKGKSLEAHPPPHHYAARSQVLVRLAPVQDSFGPSTRPMGVASQNSTLPCTITILFSSLVASLFSWRYLGASTSSFPYAAMDLRLPSLTVSTHTAASNAVAFQSPSTPNARMSLCTQSAHSFSFSPRLLYVGANACTTTVSCQCQRKSSPQWFLTQQTYTLESPQNHCLH